MSARLLLPRVHLEPGLPQSAQREAWQELTRPLFTITPLTPPDAFDASWSFHRLDRLIVSEVSFSPQEFVHDPRRHSQADNDHLLLELYEEGSGRGESGDVATCIDQDRLHLVDLSRSYRTVTTNVRTIGVVLPHASVGYQPDRHPPYLWLPVASPRGGLLAASMRGLVEQLPAVTVTDAPALAMAFAGLVRSLFLTPAATAPDIAARDRLAGRIRAYVDQHLGDELSGDELSRHFNLSRASLYRLFQAEGGVEAFIRDRRLDRCSSELMLAQAGRGRVREIAERLGFADAGHFTRAFRQRFGVAPSDLLGAKRHETGEPGDAQARQAVLAPSVSQFGDWLRSEAARPPPSD